MNEMELHDLLFSFVGLFHEKFMGRFRRHDSRFPGLKKNHYKILGMLHHHEYLISSDIGRMLDVEKGSLTTLIDQLDERGLIIRRADPCDRRKLHILLSDAGREEMNKVVAQHAGEIKELLQGMDEQKIQKFTECLKYSVSVMKEI